MRSIVVLALFATSCGNLVPTEPDSKLNNKGGNNGVAANNGAQNNGAPVEGDWDLWGTLGPNGAGGKSPAGFALCELSDVKTEDLAETNVSEVPDNGWDNVTSDGEGRCGDDLETLAWRLMNCERIGANKKPYECDLRLVWLGRAHDIDMATRDFYDHTNPDGEGPFDRMTSRGVSFQAAAENLASSPTAIDAHWAWMDSPLHRGNVLGDYTHAGVGVEPNGEVNLSTAIFLTP